MWLVVQDNIDGNYTNSVGPNSVWARRVGWNNWTTSSSRTSWYDHICVNLQDGTIISLLSSEYVDDSVSSALPTKRQSTTKMSTSQHTGNKVSTKTVFQSTVESDNKRRPIVLRRNSRKYYPPSPEPPDPNSGNQWIWEGGVRGSSKW